MCIYISLSLPLSLSIYSCICVAYFPLDISHHFSRLDAPWTPP